MRPEKCRGRDVTPSRTVEKLLEPYPSDVQALAVGARQLIRQLLPEVEECADPSAPVVGYNYGPGYSGMVCTLILSKSGVKLGLVRGAELADPRGLLAGSGKVHKYVQLRAPADLRKAGLSQLIKAAYTAWQGRNEATHRKKR
jgi:hypothetical protein